MEISYSEIIDYLIKLNTEFEKQEHKTLKPAQKFKFASTKNLVSGGFYYLDASCIAVARHISNSVILTNASGVVDSKNTYLFVANPQLLHYKLASLFADSVQSGIHKTALVSEFAIISPSAYIGPYCILENCEIGDNVQLLGNVTIRNNVLIKENTVIEGNSVIGARGMAWIWDETGTRIMQPQHGGVIIEANCIIGTDITIVRGSLTENTHIGYNCIIAHGTKIGHGSVLKDYVHVANNVSLAGNALIGERTFLGSACTVSSNVAIAPNCIVGAGAVVSKSISQEYATIVGVPGKIVKIDNFKEKPKGAPKPFKNE